MLIAGVLLALVGGFVAGASRPVVEKQVARAYYRLLAGRLVGELVTCSGSGRMVDAGCADDRGLVCCPCCGLPVKAAPMPTGDLQVLVIEVHGG